MSDESSELPTLRRVFDMLDTWRHLPAYQLERLAGVFFALFLPEVLEGVLSKGNRELKIKRPLIPEFPIWEDEYCRVARPDMDNHNLSKVARKVDYFALSQGRPGSAFLIELKTDMKSVDPAQEQFLDCVAKNRTVVDLVERIVRVLQPKKHKRKYQQRPARQKYIHLLSHLRELDLVCYDEQKLYERAFGTNRRGVYDILDDVQPASWICRNRLELEVIYVQPKPCPAGSGIGFEEFACIVEEGQGNEEIRNLIACYLRKWVCGAGSRTPQLRS